MPGVRSETFGTKREVLEIAERRNAAKNRAEKERAKAGVERAP